MQVKIAFSAAKAAFDGIFDQKLVRGQRPATPMYISSVQATVAIVLAHNTEHRILGSYAEQPYPRPARHPKTRPYFARVFVVEHERIVSRRAALALAFS